MSAYIAELVKAIRATHNAEAMHEGGRPVREMFRDQVAWEGIVESFALLGHPKAQRCYAWGVRRDDDKGWDVTAVLGIPPIVTPELAVKAAIVAHAKQVASQRPGKS